MDGLLVDIAPLLVLLLSFNRVSLLADSALKVLEIVRSASIQHPSSGLRRALVTCLVNYLQTRSNGC